jgi:hypothetical protein
MGGHLSLKDVKSVKESLAERVNTLPQILRNIRVNLSFYGLVSCCFPVSTLSEQGPFVLLPSVDTF